MLRKLILKLSQTSVEVNQAWGTVKAFNHCKLTLASMLQYFKRLISAIGERAGSKNTELHRMSLCLLARSILI